ncbi:MAG: asparaginase [Oscillospiraceae bacterium]|nr:asparaginase [Oscillospiraceae bacterium]
MHNILWLSCGGTIACPPDKNNLSPVASEEQMRDMLKKIPLPENANITPRCIMNIDSTDVGITELRTLSTAVYSGVNEGFSGLVITHGTDTMAYTAASLFFALENTPPVIITGAQLPFYEKDSDGPANLSNALKAACDRRFSGVYLLFGDKIINGDRAVKVHTTDYNAFTSAAGYAAIIQNGSFTDVAVNEPNVPGNCILHQISENAVLIKLTPFTRPCEISALTADNIKGLVIEGYGCCGVPGRLLSEIKKVSDKGVKVVFVSQCLYGPTNGERYEVGVKAAKCGVIYGFALTAEAALAKLSVTAAQNPNA